MKVLDYILFYLIMLSPLIYWDSSHNLNRLPIPFYGFSYLIEWIFVGVAMSETNIFLILILLFCPIAIVRYLQMEKNREYNLYEIWIKYLRKIFTDVLFTLGGISGILGNYNFLNSSIQSFLTQLEKYGVITNFSNIVNDFYIFIIMLGINRVIDLIIYDFKIFQRDIKKAN